MSDKATNLPLRQVLNFSLRQLILGQVCPALNAAILRAMADVDPVKVPQFRDSNVVVGDVPVPGEPTLCIVGISRRNREIASGVFNAVLMTQIRLKSPWVADDVPEDYEFLSSVTFDNIEDALTSLANRTITPTNPATGAPLLLDGASFYECVSLGTVSLNYPVRAADGVTHYAGAVLSHRATIQYALSRAGVVGT